MKSEAPPNKALQLTVAVGRRLRASLWHPQLNAYIVGRTKRAAVTIDELVQSLGAEDIKERVKALIWAEQVGPQSASALVSVLARSDANMPAKVWTMIAIARLGPAVADTVRDSLRAGLADGSPTVRRAAIQAIAALKDRSSRDAIVPLLSDDTLDPSTWFDDDCTVSQAATAALKSLDSVPHSPA
jgi:HEAT repeat protein